MGNEKRGSEGMKKVFKYTKKVVAFLFVVFFITTLLPMEGLSNLFLNSIPVNVKAETILSNPRIVEDSFMESEQMVTWDCVWFGNYPQTEIVSQARQCGTYGKSFETSSDYVVNSTLYGSLQNAAYNGNGDTIIGGRKYHRVLKSDAAKVNSTDSFYDWDDDATYHYFRYEPIKWRILNVSNGKVLLLAEKVLDDKKNYPENTLVTWENSTIRSWLNGYDASANSYGATYSKINFINTAFSSDEKAALISTSLDNTTTGPYSISYGGNNTTDQVFLLSSYDLYNTAMAQSYGFALSNTAFDEARRCTSSTYAKAMGVVSFTETDYLGNSQWWLRSPGDGTINGAFVGSKGHITINGSDISSYYVNGIRPALYLDLSDTSLYTYAGTVRSDGTKNEQGPYTVTYDANGGSGEPSPQTGVSVSAISCKVTISNIIPIKNGYSFLGWSQDSEAITATYKSGDSIVINSNTTLYAVWQKNEETTTEISISDCSIDVEPELIYTGLSLEPKVTVQYNGNTLVDGRDYSLQFQNNMEVGTGSVTITGEGNYVGSITKFFVIKAVEQTSTKSITDCEITLSETSFTYNGKTQTPEVIVKDGEIVLQKGTDYIVSGDTATMDVGTYTITVKGEGDYSGTKDITYKILPADPVLKFEVSEVTKTTEDAPFTNSLDAVTDGVITYTSENSGIATINSSTGKVSIVGTGTTVIRAVAVAGKNYKAGETSYNLTVIDSTKSIADCGITLSETSYTYNGKMQAPEVVVKDGESILQKGTDYSVSGNTAATDAGTYTITVKGEGDYNGSKDLSFKILPVDPVLKFEVSEMTKRTEDGAFTNSLDAVTDGVITYTSENTGVATVNSSTGKVSIVGTGTTVIRAVATAGKNYKAGEASYNLTVTEKEAPLSLSLENLSYSFGNIASSFGYPEKYMYPLNIYEMIFGKTTKATFWYDRDMDITGGKWRGNCAGFSGTAALMMDPSSGIKVQDFESSATSIGQLNSKSKSLSQGMDVTGFIEAMQIAQHTQLFCNEISKNRIYTSKHLNKKLKNLNGFYETVRMETEVGRPVLLALYQTGAHAVLAYEVKDISETESQILLYDSNWPEKERALTLKKDADGNFMEWFYEIGGSYGTWGTDTKNSSISYVPYSVIKEIWATKGQLKENENVLSINSGSVAIYTSGDKPVATVTQGELSTTIDDIQVIDYLSLERADSDTLLLSVPVDVYTFKNLDMSVDEFEIAITNTNLGASAVTTADSITMAVDDSCNLNAVYIDAGEDDDYSITLNSSFSYDENNVVVTGKGNGEMMEVSQTKGNININNCQITSISIDGKEIGKYKVKALVGEGGKITPEGETVVAEGESVSYNIEPSSGYAISDVLVDGRSVGAVSTYAFNNVTADHEIKALFKKKEAPKIPIENSMNQTPSNQLTPVIVNPKNPTGTTLKKLKRSGSGKMTVTWKKNNTVTGYQISYSTSSNFKKAKIVTIMNKKTTKTVLKKLNKKKKYYVRIRTYKNVGGKRYYSAWSKKKGG